MLEEMAGLEVPDYSWVRDSQSKVAGAACITVATRLSWDEALIAFEGIPDDPTLP